MECRTLDVTVLSARNLKKVRFQKSGAYVTVFISGDYRSVQKTPLDKDGKRNPKWNHPMKFTINEAAVNSEDLSLIFRIRYDNINRAKSYEVGEVRVLIKDILNPTVLDQAQTVTYSVRLSSGKTKGEVDFSYKFSDKFIGEDADVAQPMAYPALGLYPLNGSSSACPPPQGHSATSAPSSRRQHRKYKSCTCSEGKMGSGLGLGAGFGLIGSLMVSETMDKVSEGGSKTSSKVAPIQEL